MKANAELLDRAESLAEMGDTDGARSLVKQALEQDNRDPEAWYALTQLAASDAERRKAIYQLWSCDPSHPEANYLLDKLKAGTLPPLESGLSLGSRNAQTAHKNHAPPAFVQTKNYLTPAIFTLVAYWVFWIVGFGINLYFLNEARKLERETGMRQENVGCLQALAGVYIALPIAGIALVIIAAIFGNL